MKILELLSCSWNLSKTNAKSNSKSEMSRKSEVLDAPDPSVRKEALLSTMLGGNSASSSKASKVLISEVGAEAPTANSQTESSETASVSSQVAPPTPPADEGPTMLELMMAAQREASAEKKAVVEKEQKQSAKSGFGGFKKGFFGGSGSNSKPKPSSFQASQSSSSKEPVIEVRRAPASSASSAKDKAKEMVFEDVQKAMAEDTHPLLQQLRSNEWVTPDLTTKMAANPILSRGLRDPKCVAAMELLQRDPKAAQQRFQGDAEVGVFIQEFCKLMSDHFTALGEKQQPQSGEAASSSTATAKIAEVGPLQAKALAKQKPASTTPSSSTAVAAPDSEEERVQKILADPELRELLMDARTQQILLECGDPVKLRAHMQDPETKRKIGKLAKAGLVRMEGM